MRLEINNKREIGKFTNMKKLNNTLNQRTKNHKGNLKIFGDERKQKQHTKPCERQ